MAAITDQSNEDIAGRVERLSCRRSHDNLHHPRHLVDDDLHYSQVIKHRYNGADEDDDG